MPDRQHPIAARALPCDIAVLFRDAETAGGLIDRLSDSTDLRANGFSTRIGKLGERVIALGIAGKATSLVAMTDAVVFAHKPQFVVFGTQAIGLTDSISVNAVLLANSLIVEASEQLELPPWTNAPYRRCTLWATGQVATVPKNVLAAVP